MMEEFIVKRFFFLFVATLFTCATLLQSASAANIIAVNSSNDYISGEPTPYASLYLKAHKAWCYAASGGNIEINFQVTAKERMNSVGATDIYVYEKRNGSWTEVEHFSSSTTAGMLKSNTSFCSSSVTFKGTVGKEYKATVVAYAGNSSAAFDSIRIETSPVTAKK